VIPPFKVVGTDANDRTPAPPFGNDATGPGISEYSAKSTASYQIDPEKTKAERSAVG
jgi:hypothetical protein